MTKTASDSDLAVSYRSGIVENRHQVHAAVVDATGKLLFTLGDPSRVTLVRSSAKPAQAVAVVEAGAMEKFGFDEGDLALVCGSHSGEERHAERARSMLGKVEARESDLRCGGHPSVEPGVNRGWIRDEFVPTPVWSNCSGKHIGMIAGAKALGAEIGNYHEPDHPIQVKTKAVMEDLTGLSANEIKWGLDGCNMFAPAFPLHSLALMNAVFAKAADDVSNNKPSTTPRTRVLARIYNAMVHHPELIGGQNRFCTLLMEAYNGAVIGKAGADACYGIGVRESDDTRRLGAKGALGIAVKVEDGNLDVMYAATAEIIEQLRLGTAEMRAALDGFHGWDIKNTMGVVTGKLCFEFKLRPV